MQVMWLLRPEDCPWVPLLAQRIKHSFPPTLRSAVLGSRKDDQVMRSDQTLYQTRGGEQADL